MFDTLPRPFTKVIHTVHASSPLALVLGEAPGDGRIEQVAVDAGLDIVRVGSVREAQEVALDGRVEVIVVGALAGGQIDYSACHALSQLSIAPVLVAAETDDPTNRILALELGADDWVTPNCCDRELAARLRVLTRRRRTETLASSGGEYVRFSGRRLNAMTGELVRPDGDVAHLTRAEVTILQVFLRNAAKVVSRSDLLAAQGADETSSDRNVVVSVFRLRKKLGGGSEDVIRTVRSLGYVLDGPVQGSL